MKRNSKVIGLLVMMLTLALPICLTNSSAAAAQDAGVFSVDASFLSALEWRFVGPYRGGRVVAVAGDASDPLVHYFGAAHGGVWKTTDAGLNWRNVSDGFLEFPAIGGLDVSLSNPQVIFVGTGEGLQRQFISPGDGVYKSTDGGETWTHVGLQKTRHISRVRIHPTNPDIVYVAAMGDMFGPNPDRGIYRTMDGGDTWEHILYKGETTGAVDLTIDYKNPEVIIASLNHHVTYMWDEESGGPTTGLFRSTDGGDTWTDISRNPGMPTGLLGKMCVAISPADSKRVYAFIEAGKKEGGIYRSDDGGATWQRTHYDPGKMEIPNSYNHITADTQDPDVVYIQPITGLHKSTDAGRTFKRVRLENWDPHALWIDPNNARRMIEGGDGGASVTLNGGESWSRLDNQPTADLLALDVDDQEPYWIYGTQNDNSHIGIPSRTDDWSIGPEHYLNIPVGEGGKTAVKPDGSVVYCNDRSRTNRFDRETGRAPQISVWPEWVFGTPAKDIKYRFYYSFPIIVSPHDPDVVYTAAQYLFRTKDEGQTWDTISPDLTKNRQEVMGEISGGPISSNASSLFHTSVIRTIAESPLKKGELWVGTDDSNLQLSRDGGRNWNNVAPPDLPEWTTITAIDVSPHKRGTVYISGERHRVSDRDPYLYKTTDYGKTWKRITNGIRENDFSWTIREDPVRPGLLYAGTETGAYVSFNDGESWQSLQRNLPPVMVMHMQVKDDDVVVATHGRGFWILENISSLRAITPEIASAPVHLFEVVPAIRQRRGGGGWSGSPDAARNPPRGVMIEYYLAQAANSEVMVTIKDAGGEILREFSSKSEERRSPSTKAGMNRFFWDMRYPGTKMPPAAGAMDGFISIDYSPPSRPVAAPGRYVVQLSVGGQTYEQSFEIRKDPKVKASDADIRTQFDLMIDIRDRYSEVAETVIEVRKVRAKLDERRTELSKVKSDDIHKQLREIEGILTIWVGSEAHPMMWDPPGLTEKLSVLSGAVGGVRGKPTKSMYAVFEDLSERFEVQRNKLDELIDELIQEGFAPLFLRFEPTADMGTAMKVPMSTSSGLAQLHFLNGLHELDLDKPSKALPHFQSASKTDPDFALAHLGIAYASGSPEETARNLKAASMKAGNASQAEQAWINAALKGFNNDLEGQLADLKRLTKLAPSSPRAWLQLARCQKAMGRHEDSRKTGTKALDLSPEFVPALMKMGESYLFDEPRDFDIAKTYMEKILELEPNEYRSHDLLGDVYRALGHMALARIKYTRAVKLSPDDGMALHQRGHVDSFLGNFEAARADYQAAMDLSAPVDVVEFGIGKALVAVWEGNPQRAVSELEELVAALGKMDIAEPRSSKLWVLSTIVRIAAHYRLEDSARKAIQMSESILMQQADQIGSEEFRRRNKAELAYFEGFLAARLGNYEVANTRAQEFMDLLRADTNPRKNEPAHEILGMVNLLQGNYQEAVEHYQVITADYVYARYHLALAHEGAGHSEVARAMFKEAANYNFNDAGFCLIRNDAMAKAAGK